MKAILRKLSFLTVLVTALVLTCPFAARAEETPAVSGGEETVMPALEGSGNGFYLDGGGPYTQKRETT